MSSLQTKSYSFINGDLGLAKTFWLFYVLIPILLIFPFVFVLLLESNLLNVIFGVFYIGYCVVCSIAVWNSAEKYNGDKLLVNSSKFLVSIGILSIAVGYADSLLNDNYYTFSMSAKNDLCPLDTGIEWDECYGSFVSEEGDIFTGYWILDELYSGTLIEQDSDDISIIRNYSAI